MFFALIFINVLSIFYVEIVESMDYMPCSENVDDQSMARARRILENHIPVGYRLNDLYPITQTGRNPHRWIAQYERVDQIYRQDCDYLVDVRGCFRQVVPAGCEISQIVVSDSPNRQFIQVQFLVNCRCRKIPRRKRGEAYTCDTYNAKYQHEKGDCSAY